MSLEAHVLPLATFLGGDFPSPVEKLCRGKGLTYFRVPRRAWGVEPDDARAASNAVWRAALNSEEVPAFVADVDGRLGAGFHELLDSIALERLQQFAATRGAASPSLHAAPAQRWVILPAQFEGPVRSALTGALGEFAVISAPALAAELDALRPALGDLRDWNTVGEGELAADGGDSLFAEKTVWSILRWLAGQSLALRLPVVIQPARTEA